MKTSFRGAVWALSGLCAAGAVGSLALARHKTTTAKPDAPKMVYSPKGFGGYIPAPNEAATIAPAALADPVLPALQAYQKSDFVKAEALAEAVMKQYQTTSDPKEQRFATLALWLDAYSAARRKDYSVARERFTYLRNQAAQLPDHGKWPNKPGEITSSLEEEGAFQHAVCTSAMGEHKRAEEEYDDFMKSYPLSVLVHGAVKRIAKMHQGNIPAATEALWQQAMRIQQKADKEERRAASLCGPECLAELLRRRGQKAKVEALAQEMKTDENGTSLLNVEKCARSHGIQAQGMMVKSSALVKQSFPVIALISPGHFVLVEAATPSQVRVWNPPAGEKGAEQQNYDAAAWSKVWQGILLTTR